MKNICHLINLKIKSKTEIKLDAKTSIRSLSNDEQRLLKEKVYLHNKEFLSFVESSPICVEISSKEKLKIKTASSYEELLQSMHEQRSYSDKVLLEFWRFIIALWLFTGKAITMGGVLFYDEKSLYPYHGSLFPEMVRGFGWDATASQIKKYAEFWSIFKRKWFDYFDPAIWYFQEAMWSKFVPNRLLRLTIAMDRILTPDGRTELTERFSTRAALLLEKTSNKRKERKIFFRDMYKLRSGIVHGDINIKSTKIISEDYQKYFDYCRKILCIFIENNSNWKEKIKMVSLGED